MLNRARSKVAGSQTNVILPSTSEDRVTTSVHVNDRLRVTNCEHLNVGDDEVEIFVKSVDRQLEAHLRETRSFAYMPIIPLACLLNARA